MCELCDKSEATLFVMGECRVCDSCCGYLFDKDNVIYQIIQESFEDPFKLVLFTLSRKD